MMNCLVFRCQKKQEMYLYIRLDAGFAAADVDDSQLLQTLPDDLLQITGRLSRVMQLSLSPERQLARVDVNKVIQALQQQGFFIQMPPNAVYSKDSSMLFNPSDSF